MGKLIQGPWGGSAVPKAEANSNALRPLFKRPDFPHRNAMLAKVHVAVKGLMVCSQCCWLLYRAECHKCGAKAREATELDYRDFLRRVTGKTSCADMSKYELESVLFALRSIGFIDTKKKSIDSVDMQHKGMARKVEEKARLILGVHWKKRLNGWIRKAFGVDSVYFLTQKQLRAVFGFLSKEQRKTEPF